MIAMLILIGALVVNLVLALAGISLARRESNAAGLTGKMRGFLSAQGVVMWLSIAVVAGAIKVGVLAPGDKWWAAIAIMGSAVCFCLTAVAVWYYSRAAGS